MLRQYFLYENRKLKFMANHPVRHAYRVGLRTLCKTDIFVIRTAAILMGRRTGYSKRKSAVYEISKKTNPATCASCPGKWTVYSFRTEFDATTSTGSLCASPGPKLEICLCVTKKDCSGARKSCDGSHSQISSREA